MTVKNSHIFFITSSLIFEKSYANYGYIASKDNNGNKIFRHCQPIVQHYAGISKFPKYSPKGTIASANSFLYVNTTDWSSTEKVLSTWEQAKAIMDIQVLTSLPSASSTYSKQIYKYSKDGSDDQLVICLKMADGSYKWKALTLNEPI